MTAPYTVGRYLVDRLAELGLKHLFSIAGDYTIDWVNNYVEPSSIRVVEEVNELNAGYAADAYARLQGIGALCVTYSAGALCAVNAIAGAYVEKAPVVLINGAPSTAKTVRFEQTGFSAHHFISGRETDLQVFEYITSAAVRVDNPDLAPMMIDYALTQCITERRPVYIELLQDMVDEECEPPKNELRPARTLDDSQALAQSVALLSDSLKSAARPLLWIGIEVDRLGLHEKAAALIQQLDIPYVTELLSKAVLSEDDPRFAGVFDGQASSAYVQDLVNKSDLVLALGVWLTDINTLGCTIDFDKTAFVSLDAVKFGTHFGAHVSLSHLIDRLLAAGVKCTPQARPPQDAGQDPPVFDPDDALTYQGFYDVIARYVDANTIVGSDPSLNYFGTLLLKVGAPRGYIAQPSYSAIGYIGPAATGICLATEGKQRVMVFSGDGGFQMTAQCLSTQTRFGLNPIIFIIDNGVYAVEQWLADASVFRTSKDFYKSCVLHRWDYSKLADVFGCKGWRVETYGELENAVKAALAHSGSPSIIQVRVPSRTIPANAAWKSQ
jgi:indolepyruvate decarboxylase